MSSTHKPWLYWVYGPFKAMIDLVNAGTGMIVKVKTPKNSLSMPAVWQIQQYHRSITQAGDSKTRCRVTSDGCHRLFFSRKKWIKREVWLAQSLASFFPFIIHKLRHKQKRRIIPRPGIWHSIHILIKWQLSELISARAGIGDLMLSQGDIKRSLFYYSLRFPGR